MTMDQGLMDLSAICFHRLRIEILIAFRDYGFVDHVELIPPSQLLRVNVTIAISVLLPLHQDYNRALKISPDRCILSDFPHMQSQCSQLPLSFGL
jgi:hypothetical protein